MTEHTNSQRLEMAGDEPVAAQQASAAREPVADAFARHDVTTLLRLREHQASIERASELLHRVQPDLIAGETMPIKASEPQRSRWPLIIVMSVSSLVWAGITWAVLALA